MIIYHHHCLCGIQPPLTKHIFTEDLENMIFNVPDKIDILKFPCHTQAVKRWIKLLTKASSSVCGNSKVRNTQKSNEFAGNISFFINSILFPIY